VTTDQLRDLLAARPFVPFVIPMADSRDVDVSHPETIAYGGGRIAAVVRPDDSFEIIDLLLVPSLEAKPSQGGRHHE
jgi:hypothetical protein